MTLEKLYSSEYMEFAQDYLKVVEDLGDLKAEAEDVITEGEQISKELANKIFSKCLVMESFVKACGTKYNKHYQEVFDDGRFFRSAGV